MNVMGQAVKTATIGNLSTGVQTFSVDVADLSTGLYIVNVTVGTQVISQKLNIQR
ncbi:MAG: T9SS type A sorting domain-containing protein [Bacteroidetes bacterium]|nr:T9SS type A sorting domain-containing protein [Bacteroidota bacterium]